MMSIFSRQPPWMASSCAAAVVLVLLQPAHAEDLPPKEMLDAIFQKSEPGPKPQLPIEVSFEKVADAQIDPKCGLEQVNLKQSKGDERHSFSLLVDKNDKGTLEPTQFLARLNRLTVDTDGSSRAYHPEDPEGTGVCTEQKHGRSSSLHGVCALTSLASAHLRVFRGNEEIRPYQDGKRNPEFAAAWLEFWPDIKSRRLKRVDLQGVVDDGTAAKEALYYSREKNTAAVLNTEIIAFKDGYPCQNQNSDAKDYFVAETTLKRVRSGARSRKNDSCDPSQFVDASKIPFFVIPENVFTNISVGDIAIGYAKVGAADRLVFGIVGDTGPTGQIGEGSVAFINKLLDQSHQPMNSSAVNRLDINLEKPEPEYREIGSLAVLVLGNTSQLLKGNYTPANIEQVGRKALARWAGAIGPSRFLVCVGDATPNPLKGLPDLN
jgi:Fungal chitosanase of glycosyl hydrolase group 75